MPKDKIFTQIPPVAKPDRKLISDKKLQSYIESGQVAYYLTSTRANTNLYRSPYDTSKDLIGKDSDTPSIIAKYANRCVVNSEWSLYALDGNPCPKEY